MKAQQKNEEKRQTQYRLTAAARGMTRRKDVPPSQVKGNIMKNNTFDQIINSDLASIDPGFGQFALAKASADLFKKVLNK